MEKIGFAGTGIMGEPMCLNLLKAGYKVIAYNRTASRLVNVVAAGATAEPSLPALANASDVIITIVSDTPDVEEVIAGADGLLQGARAGSVIIDMSTISPSATRSLAERCSARGVDMLDAPVSGGDTGAKTGTLAIMAGGPEPVFERCRPVFEVMGKSVTRVGDHGMGQTVKLCNQILVSVTNMAVCEAVSFASKAGVDPQIMVTAVENGAAGSWQLSNLGPKMADNDFNPGFMVDLQQKDLRLALEAARELTLPLPALSLVHQLFTSCQAAGEGKEGTQALIKALRRLAG